MNRSRIQLILVLVMILGILGSEVRAKEQAVAAGANAVLLQYQGRLSDPGSDEPVPDGSYTMVFRFYAVRSGGTALWMESKDVPVQDGLFSTALGDTTPLDLSLFNGQALWLGIKVGADEEATPRQQVLPVAYALSLAPGASVQANSSDPALKLINTGSGQALRAVGPVSIDGNLAVSGSLSGGTHSHDGADVTSGQVAESRISGALARDSEVSNAISSHAAKAGAHHARYTDSEAANAALNHPEIVTEYEFQDHVNGGMHSGRALASGTITAEGSITSATGNVSSRWDSLCECYVISIEGHTYDWSYVTVVTPIAGGGIANAWSGRGKLNVGIYNVDGTAAKLPFQFVTFQP